MCIKFLVISGDNFLIVNKGVDNRTSGISVITVEKLVTF